MPRIIDRLYELDNSDVVIEKYTVVHESTDRLWIADKSGEHVLNINKHKILQHFDCQLPMLCTEYYYDNLDDDEFENVRIFLKKLNKNKDLTEKIKIHNKKFDGLQRAIKEYQMAKHELELIGVDFDAQDKSLMQLITEGVVL